ncbi:hypothetical protein CCACVL1_05714 [Corchorus capsularis]|uniref:Uncharacterized protein n=1 Tax=Corchorus capsularis TaxID=210143 RepID=A0A1R3JJB9_COCAP|nr:hypothetical protein CCACVL1_05714 [Corchorus capsularis]
MSPVPHFPEKKDKYPFDGAKLS